MAKHAVFPAACFAILCSLLGTGCVAPGPVLSPRATELRDTPFFAQTRYHCGPAALATVLAASGAAVTPDELTPLVYVPARRGSLQVEMLATPRSFARLALPLARRPEAIVAELEAGRPVLVLHNYGLPFWPRWHYAVVVGYDAARDVFVMRSGVKRRQEMRTRRFMVAWHYGGRWAMVVLRPGETAANDDPRTYLEAAAMFEREASPADAHAAFDAALRRWKPEPVAHLGRGTALYRQGKLAAAAGDYHAAWVLDPANAGARNNLAQTLLDLGCPNRARELLAEVNVDALQPPLRAAVLDTLRLVQAAGARADAEGCRTIP
jgi:tetratricopeptide (TPR) repeat protein